MRWKRMDGQVYRRHKEAIHHPSLFHFMFVCFSHPILSLGVHHPTLFHFLFVFRCFFASISFLSLGVGRCTGTRRQSIHQPTLFQTRPATVWETRSSTFFLLHVLKAPSSDRLRTKQVKRRWNSTLFHLKCFIMSSWAHPWRVHSWVEHCKVLTWTDEWKYRWRQRRGEWWQDRWGKERKRFPRSENDRDREDLGTQCRT